MYNVNDVHLIFNAFHHFQQQPEVTNEILILYVSTSIILGHLKCH